MHWDTQMSGIQIPSQIAVELERIWINYATKQIAPQEEVEEDTVIYEGTGRQVLVNVYERNPLARKKCIEHYGTSCFVCGFNFGDSFG
jgi:5-methylcytosine-specific restriction protein A